MNAAGIARNLARLRAEAPLVHNITNYVVMNTTANALLAVGASPIMAHAIDEVEELVAISSALVINIGTLSPPWIAAMRAAGSAARNRGIPVLLDPVGSGASALRTRTALDLVQEAGPAVIRGNASEIKSLRGDASGTKGVDSRHTPDEVQDDALALARASGSVVSVSGPTDLVVGGERIARIANGAPIMTRVTGMGCTASAVTGAFLALGLPPFEAAWQAMATMGIAGEIAAAASAGPGSFQVNFLDALHALDEAAIAARLRVEFADA